MIEIWRPVPNFEGFYEVSTLGRFRRIANGKARPIKPSTAKSTGYCYVNLSKDGKAKSLRAHRLVLRAFDREPRNGEQACHLNGKRDDNKLTNLKWGTAAENTRHKRQHGTLRGAHYGEKNHNSKVSDEDVIKIMKRLSDGERQSDLAAEFNMSQSGISKLKLRAKQQSFEATARAERRL